MDAVAADLVTSIWVEVVAIVELGAVGIGMEGIGWVSTLTFYLFLVSMVLPLLSLAFGPGAFLVMRLVFGEQALVLGFGWVWGWGHSLGAKLSSTSNTFSYFA